jgi:peptidyl-prolyl cis-trans isomerase B (cyclophilin B)
MKRLVLALLICGFSVPSESATPADDHPQVRLHTNMGDILLELDRAKAPKTVENFLRYVDEGFYDGTIFHRVIAGFMIQGGGMARDLVPKPAHPPIVNESRNGLKNLAGTIAMARSPNPHSATSQFFISVTDNASLDYKPAWPQGWGYAVFGKVKAGMDVVKAISELPTVRRDGLSDLPANDVIVEIAERVKGP